MAKGAQRRRKLVGTCAGPLDLARSALGARGLARARLAWADAHPCCWLSHREARAELTMARVRGAVIFVRVRECFKGRTMAFADAE